MAWFNFITKNKGVFQGFPNFFVSRNTIDLKKVSRNKFKKIPSEVVCFYLKKNRLELVCLWYNKFEKEVVCFYKYKVQKYVFFQCEGWDCIDEHSFSKSGSMLVNFNLKHKHKFCNNVTKLFIFFFFYFPAEP